MQMTRALKYQPTEAGSRNRSAGQLDSTHTASPLNKSPFPGVGGGQVWAAPRRGTAPPRGAAGWLPRAAPGSGSSRSSPGQGGPTGPGRGVPQRRPPSRPLPRGVGSQGPRVGGGVRREGPCGAARAGARAFGRARVRGCPSSACLSVCLSAPRGCGARQGPGESAPRSPAATAGAWEARQGRRLPGLRRWPPRRSESHGSPRESLVGAEEEARGAAAVSSFAASSESHPRALRSLAGCLGGSGPAPAGGGGGGAAEGGERAGGRRGVLFGDGAGAERDRPRGPPHPAGSPGSWAPWPHALPAATSLCVVRPQAQAGIGLRGSGAARRLRKTRSFGLLAEGSGVGSGGEHLLEGERHDGGPVS